MKSLVSMIVGIIVAAGVLAGCEEEYYELNGAESGLVVILPGIQGVDEASYDVESGLIRGGVRHAITIQRWGKSMPGVGGMLLNQVDKLGIRVDAVAIAERIISYQMECPGKPVHIVGHSAGGALAVFVAESLADLSFKGAEPIEGLVLLSPSISTVYDLEKALGYCNKGILNCFNPEDGLLLGIGTTVLGNLDGVPGPSAGLGGFEILEEISTASKISAYDTKLVQEQVAGGYDPHFAATSPTWIAGPPSEFILRSRASAAR